MSYLIGTDIGTLGTKSVIVNLEGKILSSAFEEYNVLSPRPGWAEQWPEIWFKAVCGTLRECLKQAKVDPKDVEGLCISGLYGGSGIPCDSTMQALRPCLIWADRRATDECREVRKTLGTDDVFKVTGNVIDPYFGYTKMLWIKNREVKTWGKIRQLVTPNAYCIYKLTGNLSIDYSSAGNYGGIFNIHKRTWSEKMMRVLGIPRSFFPEKICKSIDVVGEINVEGARYTGLHQGTPVTAGGIDAAVSALSVGALQDGDLASMIGTSMCNGFISLKPRLSPKFVNFPHVAWDKKALYSFGGIITAGYSIRWFRDQLGSVEEGLAKQRGVSAYQILDLEAEKTPTGANGLIFLPHLMVGERAPYWDDYVAGSLTGLTVYHTRAHIFRAFLEGIAYTLRYCIETAKQAGFPVHRALLVNGGAKSKLWRSILTDVTGLSMMYLPNATGAPLGDALLAGVGVGVLPDYSVIEEWLETAETTHPNLKKRNIYNERYRVYREVYRANHEVFEKLAHNNRSE
jgi:xylulokinase